MMKKLLLVLLTVLVLTGCGAPTGGKYTCISAAEAKKIMDEGNSIVLDVRTAEEYAAGHIPGAVNLALGEVSAKAETVLPDKNARILVYCRSGRRSKEASQILADLGYTNVLEFGGILQWPYEVE